MQKHKEALQKTTDDASQIHDEISSIESVSALIEGKVKSLGVL